RWNGACFRSKVSCAGSPPSPGRPRRPPHGAKARGRWPRDFNHPGSTMKSLRMFPSLLAGIAASLVMASAQAQEVTLKAINAFQEGTYFARQFEAFVKRVNEEGKGL